MFSGEKKQNFDTSCVLMHSCWNMLNVFLHVWEMWGFFPHIVSICNIPGYSGTVTKDSARLLFFLISCIESCVIEPSNT